MHPRALATPSLEAIIAVAAGAEAGREDTTPAIAAGTTTTLTPGVARAGYILAVKDRNRG